MNQLERTISSVEVAKQVGKEHKNLMRDIHQYLEYVGELNFEPSDFFIESTYVSSQGKELPSFDCTKQGCEMIGNKMIGKKGVQFTAFYVQQFNKMENHIKQAEFEIPQTRAEALRLAADLEEENQQLKLVNTELKPKATYYDLVLQSKSLLSVTQIAKDYGMSAVALNKKLHELGIQYKQGGTWHLYQKHAECGYTQSVTHVVDSEKLGTPLTKWTQQGRLFLYKELKEHGIVPNVEKGLLIEAEEM
ncbi:Rha family transcriptional regulator [Listeria booriae]|uniref:phage regulatory protein/antirepressor Ant n=1 Tax=Listeria booriae TaxID=1552123 RepID=UPI001627A2C2|nr:phage regulatory protein/antirepressor Ant [Listeria booriae]MBC1230504.1 Rha family transcriptional regulator [Listeria booriae]